MGFGIIRQNDNSCIFLICIFEEQKQLKVHKTVIHQKPIIEVEPKKFLLHPLFDGVCGTFRKVKEEINGIPFI